MVRALLWEERCGVEIDSVFDSVLESLRRRFHHSPATLLFDQGLLWAPLGVFLGWFDIRERPLLVAVWGAMACARLAYLGVINPFG